MTWAVARNPTEQRAIEPVIAGYTGKSRSSPQKFVAQDSEANAVMTAKPKSAEHFLVISPIMVGF